MDVLAYDIIIWSNCISQDGCIIDWMEINIQRHPALPLSYLCDYLIIFKLYIQLVFWLPALSTRACNQPWYLILHITNDIMDISLFDIYHLEIPLNLLPLQIFSTPGFCHKRLKQVLCIISDDNWDIVANLIIKLHNIWRQRILIL